MMCQTEGRFFMLSMTRRIVSVKVFRFADPYAIHIPVVAGCISSALGTVIFAVYHHTSGPFVAALFTDMCPLNRHGTVNALHDLLIRFKCAFSDLGTAFAAISVTLI